MNRLIRDWNELLTYEKVFRILTLIFAVALIGLAILSVCDRVNIITMELCAGMMLLFEGIGLWRKQKGVAIFNLCASAFIMLMVMVLAFL